VGWKTGDFKPSPEKLGALQNPDLVAQVLAGKKVTPPALP
jgi:hypothetical protein